MTLRELFEDTPTKPTGSIPTQTPAQMRAKADKARKAQEKISVEKAKSALRIKAIKIAAS